MSDSLNLGTVIIVAVVAIGYIGRIYLPPSSPKILAIDLGTTYSCTGYYLSASHRSNASYTVVQTQHGKKCIPSVVSVNVSTGQVNVGYDATYSDISELDTFYDSKRFIGRVFNETEFEKERLNYPFGLELHANGSVSFKLSNGTLISPNYVSALIAHILYESAVRDTGSRSFRKAVISVPAEFNDSQKQETSVAVTLLTGLYVVRIINEPTAAALAYGLDLKAMKGRALNILVLDVGGGTTDCSLLRVENHMFLTQAMAGKRRLGGQDFNLNIVEHWKKLMNETMPECGQRYLWNLAEFCKCNLSTASTWTHADPSLGLQLHMNRETFESINENLFHKVVEPVDAVLKFANLSHDDVDELVLVGGSTRIPKIKRIMVEMFGERKVNNHLDPDHTVISGVIIQASITGNSWPLRVSAIEAKTSVRKQEL